MRTCFCLFPLLLVFALGGKAQDKSTPQPAAQKSASATSAATAEKKIEPAKEADIRKLLQLTGTSALMQQTMDSMDKGIKPMMVNSLPEGDYRQTLIDLFFEKFHAKLDTRKLLDLAVPIYDKYFTDADIKGLIQFYETPLGQKTVKALPQITAELTDAGRNMGASVARDSMLEVIAEHPELQKAMEEAQQKQN
jgi:uncharacterized protein